jgi:erythromycin esterase-like protein
VPTSCEDEAVTMLRALRARASDYKEDGREAFFDAEQNALVAQNAELYYRTMIRGGPTSWNVRDRHMVETLERLVRLHDESLGAGRAKAVVWEHNTHIGDARYTDMRRAGMINVGQVVRELHGERPGERDGVVLVGFGTHRGSVIAGDEWGEPMRRMRVPEARPGSWEDLLHRAAAARTRSCCSTAPTTAACPGLDAPVDHRAIGVVYDPRREKWGNYVPTVVPRRYDAFLFVDESSALDPLHVDERAAHDEVAETYPSGM